MPGYRGHLVIGALTGGAGLYAVQHYGVFSPAPQVAGGLVALTLVASLLPDIDTASKARPYVYGLLLTIAVGLMATGYFAEAALLGVAAMLPAIGPHRGWTHAWWAAVVVPAPLWCVLQVWPQVDPHLVGAAYGASVLGYGSHLLADRVL